MSWQKRSIQLILGFPFALPIVSYAVNIGETYVQSGQNQPLNATINVTDVDPATFSVQVANPEIYKQLGLSADQKITAKFVPTSNNGGKIVLTTKAPVAAPFTDVVLNIQNKGEKNLLPKTLLMPLGDKPATTTQQPTQTIEAPPEKVVVTQNTPIDLPKTTAPAVVEVPAETAPVVAVTKPVKTKPNLTLPTTPYSIQSDGSLGTPTIGGMSGSTNNSAPKTNETTSNEATAKEAAEVKAASKPAVTPVTNKSDKATSTAPVATITYVVQRNENLWTIANRIAAKNKTNPNKVMQDIMDANPNAFENGDPKSLDAHTALKIPKYKVVPSHAGVKAAKTARQQTRVTVQKSSAKTATTHKATKPKATSHRAIRRAKYQAIHSNRATRTTRKSEMTIVAPTQSSGSSQGSTQIQNNSVSKNASPQLLEQVKQKRQNTAGQASKVSQLNSSLQSSEQKIKLQNEKLAMLEKRLKELNGK